MSCLTIADVLSTTLGEVAVLFGTAATYYPAILTGYDVATTERDPSEGAPIDVTGFLIDKTSRAPDNTIQRIIKFSLSSLGLTFEPKPMDRIVVSSSSYLVTDVQAVQILGTVASYNLSLQS